MLLVIEGNPRAIPRAARGTRLRRAAALLPPLLAASPGAAGDLTVPELLRDLARRLAALAPLAAEVDLACQRHLGARGEPPRAERRLCERLERLGRQVARVRDLYAARGNDLFPGQEISQIYRRRHAVERALDGAAPPASVAPLWPKLRADLVALHAAVDWRAFDAWYLERDGDSDR